MEILIRFSKRFEGWATALTTKLLRLDPIRETQAYIVLLQVFFTLILVVLAAWALGFQQESTVRMIHTLRTSGAASTTVSQAFILARRHTLTLVFLGLVTLSALVGYLMSWLAVRPTRQAVQFQKKFIGNIAHELRTPLAIIKTDTEVALMEPDLESGARDTFQSTLEELDRISEIINNILSFDTLVRPGERTTESIDLNAIIDTVIERYTDLAQARAIELSYVREVAGHIEGNAVAFDQLVTNLVKNALSYTPSKKDGKVTVTLFGDSRNRVAVSVSDTGIGIPERDLAHVLEPFYRGDTSRARGVGTGSSGLGLAIVNEIVRAYHGTISIKSALGRGTTITASFPSAPDTSNNAPEEGDFKDGTRELSRDFG